MKRWLIFPRKKNDGFERLCYQISNQFEKYMADPVAEEKKIIISRGIDVYNIGLTPRTVEIEAKVCGELQYADQQLDEHLEQHNATFIRMMKRFQELNEKANRLTDDLNHLDSIIQNLESQIKEMMAQ